MGKLSVVSLVILCAVVTKCHNHEDIVNKINKAQNLWTAEHNYITKHGQEYMRKLMGTVIPKDTKHIERKKIVSNDNIPDQFDARSQWPECPSIAAIHDQGACGSCWAIAAASSASDRLCVSTNTQLALNLSAQNLVSCCFFCSILGGCNGGIPSNAWAFIKYFGIVTGGDYNSNDGCQPYAIPPIPPRNSTNSTAANGWTPTPICSWTCTNTEYVLTYFRDKRHGNSFYTVENSVSAIQTELLTNGPVQASFKVFEDFMHYKDGIYIQSSREYLGGHSVKLVGWGTDPISQVDYWIAANSWNTTWGDNGWFKIRRGRNECGIEEYVTTGTF